MIHQPQTEQDVLALFRALIADMKGQTMEEKTTVENSTEPAKRKTQDSIREVGLVKFNGAMTETTRHINMAATLLSTLTQHKEDVQNTVEDIQRWRAECESKLKHVPTPMIEPIRAIFTVSEEELYNALREISEEMQMIDLSADPPEQVRF